MVKDKGLSTTAIILIVVIIAGASIGASAYVLTRPQPDFQVRELSVSSEKVARGDTVTAQVEVMNTGDAKSTHTVKLEIENETLRKKVTLGPGESRTLDFDIEKQERGTYSLSIEDLSESFEVVEPAEFEVSDLTINPSKIESGENAEISASVKNTGDLPGKYTVELRIDEETVTRDDFSNTQLNENLSLFGFATYDPTNSRISFMHSPRPPEAGGVVDNRFSSDWRNWIWKGRIVMDPTGHMNLNFYADGIHPYENAQGVPEAADHGYNVSILVDDNVLALSKMKGAKCLAGITYHWLPGEPYDLKVEFQEGLVEIYVDGTSELLYTISQPDYTHDKFSLSAWNDGHILGDYQLSKLRTSVEPRTPIEDSKTVELDGGETTTVNFEITMSEAGTYNVSLDSLSALTSVAFAKDIYEQVCDRSSVYRAENVVSAENYSFEPVENGNFTIGVLPDTQIYSDSYPKIFDNIVRWIIGHESTWNIEFVSQEGDLVQNYSDSTEWKNAQDSMRKLDNHIPYGFLAGNHDKGPSQAADMMNRYFPSSYYEGNWSENWWSGCYRGTKNNYQLISVSEMDLLFLHLEYNPSNRVLDWAGRVLDNYPNRFGVITAHSYLGLDSSRTKSGERIWNELVSRYSNVHLVLCGHIGGEAKSTVVEDNRIVNQVLANYQARNNGGNGWIRLLTFNSDENLIQVRTYSPFLRMFETDKGSQFRLRWN